MNGAKIFNNIFIKNSFTDVSGGYALFIFGSGSSHPQNISFNYDGFIGDVRFTGYAGELSSENIMFCQVEGLIEADIILGAGIHDFTFTQSDCPYSLPVGFSLFSDGFEG